MIVSENRGTPKWMVKIMDNPEKLDVLEGKPTILGNIQRDWLFFWGEKRIKNRW